MDFAIPDFETHIDSSDYEKDGLIYCGECGTPKQCQITLFGESRIVPCLCRCAKEKLDEEERKKRELIRRARAEEMRNEAFQDGRMREWTFENDDGADPEFSKKMRNYAEHFNDFCAKGRGLILYGTTGNGKTFMGCCVANKLIDNGFSVLVKNFNTISNELFATAYKDEYMDRLNRVSLLMVDDLDIERESAYMNEVVYSVIDGRYRAKKPVIVTTNLSSKQMKEAVGDKKRVYSRLVEMCIPIHVTGADRRYSNAKKTFEDDMKLLNGE